MQVISIGGVDYVTQVGALYARFVDMGAPVKTQVGNGFSKIILRGQTIDLSDQATFILKYLVITINKEIKPM